LPQTPRSRARNVAHQADSGLLSGGSRYFRRFCRDDPRRNTLQIATFSKIKIRDILAIDLKSSCAQRIHRKSSQPFGPRSTLLTPVQAARGANAASINISDRLARQLNVEVANLLNHSIMQGQEWIEFSLGNYVKGKASPKLGDLQDRRTLLIYDGTCKDYLAE
jgi:hypothetical protein